MGYTHGHHESVVRAHTWRTAENSAAYLVPELAPGLDVLDVGCGPGTITADLASLVAPGRVVGIDTHQEILLRAAEVATARGLENTLFEVADARALPYGDGSFDVVHAHQVLQHLDDPVAALAEMRRVLRPGGVLAVRDADYGAMVWHPQAPGLHDWQYLYRQVARANGGEPDAGRRLRSWVRQAGFTELTSSVDTWCFSDGAERDWWADGWAERTRHSGMAKAAIDHGLADADELARIAQAWHEWARDDDGWFVVVHGEVLARR